jgi:L-iditol 2-dehydrogenase
MKVSQLVAPRTFEVVDDDDPVPGDDQVLVDVVVCGVCTSDLGPWLGHDPSRPPVRLGHEMVGRVVSTGRDANRWAPGDLVTGLGGDGFATLAVMDSNAILPVPTRSESRWRSWRNPFPVRGYGRATGSRSSGWDSWGWG